jgi:hypothetical protein
MTCCLAAVALCAPFAGCRHSEPAPSPAQEVAQPLTDPRFTDILLQDAAAFPRWFTSREPLWSPAMCTAPVPHTFLSTSSDRETHGRKLYHLYVREPVPYGAASPANPTFSVTTASPHLHYKQPVGQALVKQTWLPREVPPDTLMTSRVRALDGKLYVPSEPGPLFIMHKLDPSTPNTDQGWVYATLTPDGSKVTASGRIGSCMKCHEVSAYDRMFGVQGR